MAANVNNIDIEEEIENMIPDWLFNPIYSDDSDSDSSEEERPRQRRIRMKYFVERTVCLYSRKEFREHFRLRRFSVDNVINRFRHKNFLINREPAAVAITHERAFLMSLWYLANTETFRQIADRFDMARSTAHQVLINTVDFINSLLEEQIVWPMTNVARREISDEFYNCANIPNVIGAIDGCYIRIRRPVCYQRDYFCRKRFHSVILQGVATAEKLFTDVYIGEPGSVHDARVLRKSPLYEHVLENRRQLSNDYILLGDSAYPNLQWILSPIRDTGNLTRNEREFNYKHSATRIKIEHAFGLLKSRFRRLRKFDNLRIDIIVKCIMASCILHNICIREEVNETDSDSSSNDSNSSDEDSNDSESSDNENMSVDEI